MAGGKTNTIVYRFEGDTRDLEEDIKRLTSKFKSLKKAKTDSVTGSYSYEGETLDLMQAYEKIVKAQRGVRSMLKKGQGILTKEDKEDLKQLRKLRSEIEEGLANPDTFKDAKSVDAYQKKVKTALRIAHRLRKRALEASSKTELKESKAVAKERERLEQSLSPEEQAAASLNAQNFERLKGFADMSNPQEAAFIEEMQSKVTAYKSALKDFNAEQSRYNSLVNKSETDTQRFEQAQAKLAAATVSLNDAYKNGINNLRKMSQLQNKSNKKKGGLMHDFGKKLYSQTLRQIASSIISAVISGVKEALAKISQVSDWFNNTMTEITSSLKYAINSIAASVAPLLRLVAPIFEFLADLIAKLSEKLGKFFALLTGSDTWIKATKQVEDYRDAVNKASGVKGIDELNKLDQENNPFEEVDVDSTLNLTFDLLSVIDQVLADLEPLLDVVFELLDKVLEVVGAILLPIMDAAEKVLQPIVALVSTILDVVIMVIDQLMTSLNPLVESLAYLLSDVGKLVTHIVLALMPLIEPILQIVCAVVDLIASVLSDVIDLVDFLIQLLDPILSGIVVGVAGAFGLILSIVAQIVYLVGAIVKTLIKVFTFQWNEIPSVWSNFADMSKNLWIGWGKTFKSSTDGIFGTASIDTSRMATGGVVSEPTLAMVGEGKYSEAVVPLGQSPQFVSMKQSIAEEVVASLGVNNSSNPSVSDRPVILNIDGRTLARALWPQLINTQYQVGVKLK